MQIMIAASNLIVRKVQCLSIHTENPLLRAGKLLPCNAFTMTREKNYIELRCDDVSGRMTLAAPVYHPILRYYRYAKNFSIKHR